MTSHVIIDRRKNDKGKSTVNRRKFVNRIRARVKQGVKDIVSDAGSIKDIVDAAGHKIKIPVKNISEPYFQHDESGTHHIVTTGNDRYRVGDRIERPPSGNGGGSGGSGEGDGEDEFSFTLSRDEFLDIFFENCELPDMVKRSMVVLEEESMQRSGYTSDGSPTQLNIVRSMRGAKARRSGLRALKNKKLKKLEEERETLIQTINTRKANNEDYSLEQDHLDRVEADIEVLKKRIKSIPFIDPFDLRFNNWEKQPQPSMQAVMFCVMDVSASMDEERKRLAKTFFILLYLFLRREYQKIKIVFVQYHTLGHEVDEETFYYGRATGGTITSTGLQVVSDIINERYSPDQWNIYVAHASDGDNWTSDNPEVTRLMETNILPACQYYAYVETKPHTHSYDTGPSLWDTMEDLSGKFDNMNQAVIQSEPDIYPVFHKLFKKDTNG